MWSIYRDGHLENRKKSVFCQKSCKLEKLLIVITLLMHNSLLIELITIINSWTCLVQLTPHMVYVTFSAKVCPSRLLKSKINFSTLGYVEDIWRWTPRK